MSYCTGKKHRNSKRKSYENAGYRKKPVGIIADRFGVHRSTIWRWYQKWLAQNHIELENPVRRKYLGVSAYKYEYT